MRIEILKRELNNKYEDKSPCLRGHFAYFVDSKMVIFRKQDRAYHHADNRGIS